MTENNYIVIVILVASLIAISLILTLILCIPHNVTTTTVATPTPTMVSYNGWPELNTMNCCQYHQPPPAIVRMDIESLDVSNETKMVLTALKKYGYFSGECCGDAIKNIDMVKSYV